MSLCGAELVVRHLVAQGVRHVFDVAARKSARRLPRTLDEVGECG
jgi:hypothetical protein